MKYVSNQVLSYISMLRGYPPYQKIGEAHGSPALDGIPRNQTIFDLPTNLINKGYIHLQWGIVFQTHNKGIE